MKKRRKAQAAIEFLTTYSWAIMAILISIGALSYFDFLRADRYVSESCSTGSQLECLESQIEQNGVFRVNLRNNYPVNINITRITVTLDNGAPITTNPDIIIPRGRDLGIPMPGLGSNLPTTRKMRVDLEIGFKRVGSNSEYNITGSTTAKVTDSSCGNNNLDPGEICDGTNFGGTRPTCVELGFTSGTVVTCTSSCTLDTSLCSLSPGGQAIPTCGDEKIDQGEQCEPAIIVSGEMSLPLCNMFSGFTGNQQVSCTNCRYDTSACTSVITSDSNVCQDIVLEYPRESCENWNLVYMPMCKHIPGKLATDTRVSCNSGCTDYDTSMCSDGAVLAD